MYRSATHVFSLLMIVLGVAILVRTLVDGFGIGVILGILFVAAGVGRLLLLRGSAGG